MNKGFSLVELLTVMAIIAVLAVIATVQYNKFITNAAYTKLSSNLQTAKTFAESVVADEEKFPDGTCDASAYSGSGSVKYDYDSTNDNMSVSASGGLSVDIPLKITFTRNATDATCGEIKIECPKNKCSGLKNHDNSGGAVICQSTCGAVTKIKEDTNIHGVINGGCP
jgi:prepilin-type N-terminal cleavage/methylation domain-containing protein